MIILEGPDGAGKTLLTERLASDLKVPVKPKVVAADMSSEIPLAHWAKQEIVGWPEKAIYDRFPLISEMIYSPIFRTRPRPGFDELAKLGDLYREFFRAKPIVVVCLPRLAVVVANATREDTDNSAVVDKICPIYWLYHALLAQQEGFLHWDYENSDYDKLISDIKAQAWRRHHIGY